jgi:hypothetical protein
MVATVRASARFRTELPSPQPRSEIVSSPNHSNDHPDIHLIESDLREGLENSRQIVRQSRFLIELSESDGSSSGDGDNCPTAY